MWQNAEFKADLAFLREKGRRESGVFGRISGKIPSERISHASHGYKKPFSDFLNQNFGKV